MYSAAASWPAVLAAANPWWQSTHTFETASAPQRPRPHLKSVLEALAEQRPLLLSGPRAVGKTVLVHHAIQSLLAKGLPPGNVCYLPVAHPALALLDAAQLTRIWGEATEPIRSPQVPSYLFLDEPDDHRFKDFQLADGSNLVPIQISARAKLGEENAQTEAAARRLYLPPLSFAEFCAGQPEPIGPRHEDGELVVDRALIDRLNRYLGAYLQTGSYPSPTAYVGDHLDRFLPRSFTREQAGVSSQTDLHLLLLALAYDNGEVTAPERIAQTTGLAKNTIAKYLSLLEDHQVIRSVHRISRWGGRLKRARTFRTYLTQPGLPYLLQGLGADEASMQRLATGALLAQLPLSRSLVEHPWHGAGLGLAKVGPKRKVNWAMEVTYRDDELEHAPLVGFCRIHHLEAAIQTTRTRFERLTSSGVTLNLIPLALQCYVLGYRACWQRGLKLIYASS